MIDTRCQTIQNKKRPVRAFYLVKTTCVYFLMNRIVFVAFPAFASKK